MTILNDIQISILAKKGMINPFVPEMIRDLDNDTPALSFGLGSYGYDVRLSPNEFKIFRHIPGTVINPKAFNPENLESVLLQSDAYGDYFIIPANSYGLGFSVEVIAMPSNVTAICLGKSTYARVGLICNTTPLEAAWRGFITLEFSNSASTDCRIYANEGVCQLLFFEGEKCGVSYGDRQGKYRDQSAQITLPKV